MNRSDDRRAPRRGARGARGDGPDLRQLRPAAAHEIRNPLNTMAIHCELLETRLPRPSLTEKEREAILRSVAVLTGEVQRIDKILDQFLTHAGPPEADREPVDADAWIDEVVRRCAGGGGRGPGCSVALAHPPLGRWNVDAVTLARALQAVVENAVLATPAGPARCGGRTLRRRRQKCAEATRHCAAPRCATTRFLAIASSRRPFASKPAPTLSYR